MPFNFPGGFHYFKHELGIADSFTSGNPQFSVFKNCNTIRAKTMKETSPSLSYHSADENVNAQRETGLPFM
ncbi:MAG: hypothetical protein HC767_00460 [Akkermansiaceae bacterium]|nr:hypothetical protein [Akkermansiaceae bacterium]